MATTLCQGMTSVVPQMPQINTASAAEDMFSVGAAVHYRPGVALGLQPLGTRQITKPPATSPEKRRSKRNHDPQVLLRLKKVLPFILFNLQEF
jgi:hypothetical protein